MIPRIAFLAILPAFVPAFVLSAWAQGAWAQGGSAGVAGKGAGIGRLPGIVSSCRMRAEREALAEGSYDRVEWTDKDRPAAIRRLRRKSGPSFQEVEVSGRIHAVPARTGADSWTGFKSLCDYVQGHEVAMEIDFGRTLAVRLDLGLSRRPEAYAPPSEIGAPPPAIGAAAGPVPPPATPMRRLLGMLKPTFTEVPYEIPLTRRQDDFMYNHQFGLKLNTPF